MNLEKKLIERPGIYKSGRLKKSYKYISEKLGVTPEDIRIAVSNLRKKDYVDVENVEKVPIGAQIKMSSPNVLDISNYGSYLVTGCVHAPFHNRKMYESIYNYVQKELSLTGLILAGDIADLNSLSSHDRGKMPIPGVTLSAEYDGVNNFLDEIESVQDFNTKIYLFGNHEDRYFRAISDVNTYKYGDALVSPLEALKLANRGYSVVQDWKTGYIKMGDHLDINHGEFINVHTAKKTIDTYKKSTLYFHTHRFQIYSEGDVGGFNMGWGGDINSPVFNYATRSMKRTWLNAAAIVTIDKDGYYVQPLIYVNDKLVVNGKAY